MLPPTEPAPFSEFSLQKPINDSVPVTDTINEAPEHDRPLKKEDLVCNKARIPPAITKYLTRVRVKVFESRHRERTPPKPK